uniref:Mucin-2-like n=1 Tax=Cicer arietinum TaxID=3827 RepID=A0A1S2YWX6_CICAR|nr:mucin-2-like [Cicer arietinum]
MARTKQSARKNAYSCTPPSSSSSYQSIERSPSPPPRPSPPHTSSASPSSHTSQEVLNLIPLSTFLPPLYTRPTPNFAQVPPHLRTRITHPRRSMRVQSGIGTSKSMNPKPHYFIISDSESDDSFDSCPPVAKSPTQTEPQRNTMPTTPTPPPKNPSTTTNPSTPSKKTDVLTDLFEEDSARFLATYLKPLPKVFNNMCQHTLIPHCGSHEYVSDNEALLIYHLLNCKRLNLPHVILQHMICAAKKDYRKNIVPYGMVLTKIFRHFGVSLASEQSLIKISKFSTKNLSHMRKIASAPTPTPPSCPTSLKRKRSSGKRPSTNPISFSSPSTDPKEISDKIPTPERSPPPPEHIPSPCTLFAQTSDRVSSAIPSYTLHCPIHDFSTYLSNPLLSTMSPLFVSPQKTSSSIFGISQFLNFSATAGPSTSSIGPLPSVSSSFVSIPSLSTMPIPSNTVVATSSQPSAHFPSTSTLAAPSNSDIMAALQIIMARQVQHDQETALLRTWMADHLALKLGIPPPPPHPVPPPSQTPHPGKSSSSEGSSPSLAS